ncbi:hypothetical protein BP5796_11459 [Coleophoma crateriformis]|uniref:Uncharacterized protein n=1 Tax=Coleophoma crateriformis TaxID=565419 RepID=A0A3D8QIJ7_9HELO|nr:hypothetical protein BP5796_11459 [Coleophoma crateriformis]
MAGNPMNMSRTTIIRVAICCMVGTFALFFLVPWYKDTLVSTPLDIRPPSEILDSPALPHDLLPISSNPTDGIDLSTSNSHEHDHGHASFEDATTSSFIDKTTSTALSHTTQTSSAILRVGEALESTILTSPNKKYRFGLKSSGQLSLTSLETGAEIFSSNTALYWPVDYHVELTRQAVLELTWTNDTATPSKGKPWSSALLPDCDGIDITTNMTGAASSEAEADIVSRRMPVLELLDSGLLQIRSDAKVVCVLNKAVGDTGRLAIVYAGYLRTYMKTCADHKKKLVDTWTGSGGVDVHVYSYLEEVFHEDEDNPTRESIEKNLRDCFGDSLKSVNLVNVQEVAETWNDAPQGVINSCGQSKLDRHVSQWKSIYAASTQVQRYMIQHGVRYEYILKTRPDLFLHGIIPPLEELVPMTLDGTIVAPRVAMDWNWYTMRHDGELIAGVTDIMAFGKSAQMWTYMNIFRGFKDMTSMEMFGEILGTAPSMVDRHFAKWQNYNTHGHSKVDGDKERCTPEGSLAYWLSINDIPVKTDWRFEMAVLRNSGPGPRLGKELGHQIFSCPIEGKKWLCPGL